MIYPKSRFSFLSRTLACALFLGVALCTNARADLLQNGDFSRETTGWVVPKSEKVSSALVDGPAKKPALQLQLAPAPDDNPWAIIVRQTLGEAVKKGDSLYFRAWLRSPQSLKTRVFVETKDADYTKSLNQELTLSPEWKAYDISGLAKSDAAAGEMTLGFHLAYGAGTVEIADVQLALNAPAAQAATPPAPVAVAPVAAAPVAVAPVAVAPVAANQSLLQNGDFAAELKETWAANGPAAPTLSVVREKTPGSAQFVRASVAVAPTDKQWNSRLTATKSSVAIAKGSLIGVKFWARSQTVPRLTAVFQQAVDPYDKTISAPAPLTADWQQYTFYGVTQTDFAAGASNFEFHLGFGNGDVDIAGIEVVNFGALRQKDVEATFGVQKVDYWGGPAPTDAWKTAAFERIEKYRKADFKLRLVDAKGKPIPNAKVKLMQTRQLFRWGSAVPASRITEDKPGNARFRAEFERLFNTAVFENDLKWENKNPRKTEQALEALKWLEARDIAVRGHTLVWGSRKYLPPEAAAAWDDTEKLRGLVRQRVRDQVTTFKGRLYVWDVVNEAFQNTELWEKLGWDEFANVYKIAREVDPNVKLAYNDYNISNENQNPLVNSYQRVRVAELIQLLRKEGASIDVYGDQAHMGLPLTAPARMVEIWQEVAKLGLPIEITEFDVGVINDEIHGQYVEDTLIAAFSVPQVETFMMWGFWENSHWRAAEGGAMFRADWSKRPAQEVYEKWVLDKWKTNATLTTDKNGVVQTRGFLGDYQMTIEQNGKSQTVPLSLDKDGWRAQLVGR